MRHLQSHRSSLLNFEEAAYYKYCITRPFHLSDPVLRGGRTAPPSLTVPFTTCGGLGARGPYEGCSLYEKKLGRTRGVKRILFYQISTVSACGTARTARGKNETVPAVRGVLQRVLTGNESLIGVAESWHSRRQFKIDQVGILLVCAVNPE